MRTHLLFALFVFIRIPFSAPGQDLDPHPMDGALLPTRGTLMRIPSEVWNGLPKGTHLPSRVDLRPNFPPPGDQGRQNSCIAWTLAYGMMSYQEALRQGTSPVDSIGTIDPTRTFSPAYPYNLTKTEFDTTDATCMGSHFDKVFSVLMQQGCCTWADMPYDPTPKGCFQPVNARTRQQAVRGSIAMPLRVTPWELDQLRGHLAQGTPIAFAMGIDTAFKYGGKRAATNGVPFSWRPACAGSMPGSHAMLVVGYDDADSTFLVMNSWGPGWGEGGFCRLRYDVFGCHVTEAYIARDPLPPSAVQDEPELVLNKVSERRNVRAKLKPGETTSIDGLTLGLAQHEPEQERVALVVSNNQATLPIEALDLKEDEPVRFFNGNDLVTVTYTKASRKQDVRRTRAHIVARVEAKGIDPCVERAISLADRIRSARASLP